MSSQLSNHRDLRRRPVRRDGARAGNTLVLVTAILVLLVIIATAFIARTQGGRSVTAAQQRSFQREDHAQLAGEQMASELVQSLFARPIDPYYQAEISGYGDPLQWLNDGGNDPNLATLPGRTWSGVPRTSTGNEASRNFTAVRYGLDAGDYFDDSSGTLELGTDFEPDGIFDFNYAPYEVRPFTNWPDDPFGELLDIPYGPGAPGPDNRRVDQTNLSLGAGNPQGNPGYGDFRLLRDSEPRRLGAYYDGDSGLGSNNNPFTERFTHWTHLSWVPTAENGWRVCYDISNVAPLEAYGGPLGPENGNTLSTYAFEYGVYANADVPVALQTPYEQWYPNVIPQVVEPFFQNDLYELPSIYTPDFGGGSDADEAGLAFSELRELWFGTPRVHFETAASAFDLGGTLGSYALPNFIDLSKFKYAEQYMRQKSLGSDTSLENPDGPDGQGLERANDIRALRREIENTFCDTDGDGFTDSFWFVPPTPVDRGVRQVIGVSVVDNGGMLDANVATVFDRWSTSGATPSDLALVSRLGGYSDQNFVFDSNDTHVGLFVDPKNTVGGDINSFGTFYPYVNGPVASEQVAQRYRPERWAVSPEVNGERDLNAPTFLNMRGIANLTDYGVTGAGPFFGEYRAVISGFGKDTPDIAEKERRLWNRSAQNDGEGIYVQEADGAAALVPFTTTPFTISDEVELRSYFGQNQPYVYSRFERAVDDIYDVGIENGPTSNGGNFTGADLATHNTILRSGLERQESTPLQVYALQDDTWPAGRPASGHLTNEQLTRDIRHRTTLLSGTRNEKQPMWLWPNPYTPTNKIDLRYSYAQPTDVTGVDATSGSYPALPGTARWEEQQAGWLDRLQNTLVRTLVYQEDPSDASTWDSYFSSPLSYLQPDAELEEGDRWQTDPLQAFRKTHLAAASMTANIEAFRDAPAVPYLHWKYNSEDQRALPIFPEPQNLDSEGVVIDQPLPPELARRVSNADTEVDSPSTQYLPEAFVGLEKQPFITQAYFGLVYPRSQHDEGPLVDTTGGLGSSPAWPDGFDVPRDIPGPGSGDLSFPYDSENDDVLPPRHYVDDSSEPVIVMAIQIANPFKDPVSLSNFGLRIGGVEEVPTDSLWFSEMACPHPIMSQLSADGNHEDPDNLPEKSIYDGYRLNDLVLGPAEPDAPRTAVIFAVIPTSRSSEIPVGGEASVRSWIQEDWPEEFPDTEASSDYINAETFTRAWLDALDLEPGDLYGYEEDMLPWYHQSLVLDASRLLHEKLPASRNARIRSVFDTDHVIELFQEVIDTRDAFASNDPDDYPDNPYSVRMVVDRLDQERVQGDSRDIDFSNTLATLVAEDTDPSNNDGDDEEGFEPPARALEFELGPNQTGSPLPDYVESADDWAGIRIGSDDFYLTWARVSRNWGWDVNNSGMYDMDEISPRYIFSVVNDARSYETEADFEGLGGPRDGVLVDRDTKLTGFVRPQGDGGTGGGGQPGSGGGGIIVDGYEEVDYRGDTFTIEDLEGWAAATDTNLMEPIRRVLPLAYQDDDGDAQDWFVDGKPVNFSTWAVLNEDGTAVDYEIEGFPIEVLPNNGATNWTNVDGVSGYREDLRENDIFDRDVVPMDLVATQPEDYFYEFRSVLWGGPLQMLLKDDDIEQVGELTHAFMWGPVLGLPTGTFNVDTGLIDVPLTPNGSYIGTKPTETTETNVAEMIRTFPEVMTEIAFHQDALLVEEHAADGLGGFGFARTVADDYPVGRGRLSNRLDLDLGYNNLDAETLSERPWRQVLGGDLDSYVPAYRPKLPAGSGLFDAVTVDGRGFNAVHPDLNKDGLYSIEEAIVAEVDRFDLVRGYSGKPTKGLVNINTASVEVMRALPQMSRLVYNDYFETGNTEDPQNVRRSVTRSAIGTPAGESRFNANFSNLKHIRVAEGIERYRMGDALPRYAFDFASQGGDGVSPPVPQPSMADRGFLGLEFGDLDADRYRWIPDFYGYFPGMRSDRGILSLGELLTMQRTGAEEYRLLNGESQEDSLTGRWVYRNSHIRGLALDPYSDVRLGWDGPIEVGAPTPRERFFLAYRDFPAAEYPFPNGFDFPIARQADARVSTDRNSIRRSLLGGVEFAPDSVGGDAEEMNLLFSGMANMITTRSDVFTVYMTIRTFKQDPTTGIWDASKPANIIDESRYMMVVDRSEVEAPTDKPRILAFSKVE